MNARNWITALSLAAVACGGAPYGEITKLEDRLDTPVPSTRYIDRRQNNRPENILLGCDIRFIDYWSDRKMNSYSIDCGRRDARGTHNHFIGMDAAPDGIRKIAENIDADFERQELQRKAEEGAKRFHP